MIVVDRLGNVQTNGEGQNNLLKKLYGTFLYQNEELHRLLKKIK